MKLRLLLVTFLLTCAFALFYWTAPADTGDVGAKEQGALLSNNYTHQVGDSLDSFQGVSVYYNGDIDHVLERNLSPSGYNIGLKYQCVEFVKRFYLEHYQHEMPHSYGHAKDFFNPRLAEGAWNTERGLFQFPNGSQTPPRVGDILVYNGYYGHVVIVTEVTDSSISFIQQNPGPEVPSRESYPLKKQDGRYFIYEFSPMGWLGKR